MRDCNETGYFSDVFRNRGQVLRKLPLTPALTAALLAMSLLPGVLQVVAAAEVESRETVFHSAAYCLNGTVTYPVWRAVIGGVLIIPGSGPVDRDGASRMAPSLPPVYREWAEQLSEAGFAVLRYDKRLLTYPDIDIPSFDQEAQIADALSALASLRSLLGSTPQPIFMIGHSKEPRPSRRGFCKPRGSLSPLRYELPFLPALPSGASWQIFVKAEP